MPTSTRPRSAGRRDGASTGWGRSGNAGPPEVVRTAAWCLVGLSIAVVAVAGAVAGSASSGGPASAAASSGATAQAPTTTVSRYESSTEPSVLGAQGTADGRAGLSGVAILDFGRPAETDGEPATLDFGTDLDPLSVLVPAVEAYADAYRQSAPRGASMTVLLGTNDSCGTGQPCGSGTCGCVNEPLDFVSWGQAWGQAVAQIGAYLSATASGFAGTATAGGADDAEPAYDPAFTNTYDVVAGYDEVTSLPMVDFGSIDGGPTSDGFWTPEQMYLLANGLRPDAALPEIYHPGMADQWAALSHWAVSNAGGSLPFAGVLTEAPAGFTPEEGAAALHSALSDDFTDTSQASWLWSSNMQPES